MADDRQEYEVTVGGVPHTMLLTKEDAARYGENARQVESKSRTVANKSRSAQNK